MSRSPIAASAARLVILVALPCLAGACLWACGEKTVNSSDFKDAISDQFDAKGVALHSVSCPDDIKAEVGTRFACSGVNPAGTKLVINGRITDVSDDRAQARYVAAYGVAQGTKIARQARAIIERKVGQRAKGMTCPKTVRIPTRPSVTCTLTTPGGMAYDATVTVTKNGRLQVQVADEPKSGS